MGWVAPVIAWIGSNAGAIGAAAAVASSVYTVYEGGKKKTYPVSEIGKPKAPKPADVTPAKPTVPPPPDPPESPYDMDEADAKAKKETKARQIAAGRQQTILTGSLLEEEEAPVQKKVLKKKLGG